MAPMVANQSRTIIITPSKLSLLAGDENTAIIENAELPKYAVGLFESNGPGPRKRKRLTHLTPEEKIMRRKLKNRVAAQTARDRKKARLETLEETVTKIHEQTKKLLDVNAQLLERTEALEKENQVLRQRLGLGGDCSFTENQRQTLENIKEEFDEILLPEDSQHAMRHESSDEDYCVLTPCDDISSGGEVRSDGSMCRLVKCGSPVPAAGSCHLGEADPLVNEAQPIINTNYTTASDASESGGEPDLSRILREIAENFDAKKLSNNSSDDQDGDATGSSEIILVPGDVSQHKITVPLNVFGDHEYFKPEPRITLGQQDLPAQVPEVTTSASQSSFPVSIDSKKPAALVEESCRDQHVASQVTDDIQKTLSPFMDSEMEKPDGLGTALPDSLMDVSSLDDIFDNLFTDSSVGDSSSSDGESDSLSTASETASCPSPASGSLETPSPIFDTVDPFELRNISSFWDDPFTADLFPQLAV